MTRVIILGAFIVFFTGPVAHAQTPDAVFCRSYFEENLPSTATLVEEAAGIGEVIKDIRSKVFDGYTLAGKASGREIVSLPAVSDPSYHQKLAGRLAYFEKMLADSRHSQKVFAITDESFGDIEGPQPTQELFMQVARHKANHDRSQMYDQNMDSHRKFRYRFMWPFMAVFTIVQAWRYPSECSFLQEIFLHCPVLVFLAGLDFTLVKFVSYLHNDDFSQHMTPTETRYMRDHVPIRQSETESWAYLTLNFERDRRNGTARKLDLFSHWDPETQKLRVVLLGIDSEAR